MNSELDLLDRTRRRMAEWLAVEGAAQGWSVRVQERFSMEPGADLFAEFAVYRDNPTAVPWVVIEMIAAEAKASATLKRFRHWRQLGVAQTWMAQPATGALYHGVGENIRFPKEMRFTGSGEAIPAPALFEA